MYIVTMENLWRRLSLREREAVIIEMRKDKKFTFRKCLSCKNNKNHRYEDVSNMTYYEAVTCSKECEEYLKLLTC